MRAFTLIELMVVLAILGALLGLVPAAWQRASEAIAYRNFVRELQTAAYLARAQARQTGETSALLVDLRQRQFSIERGEWKPIPRGLELAAEVAHSEQQGRVAAIRFWPDGGGSGGVIVVRRPTGGGVELRVDWLLGLITLEPVA